MKLPGFQAAESLGKARGHYRTGGTYNRVVEAVEPAQVFPPLSCGPCAPGPCSTRCCRACRRQPGGPIIGYFNCAPEACVCECSRTITRCCGAVCTPISEPVPCPV
jgi:hypothetical protein